MLPQALDTLKAWGFTFKTAGVWGKQSSTGAGLAFGTGYIYRSAAEIWLVGTMGNPKLKSRSIRNFILAPIQEHSRKPDQMHIDIESLWDGPYLEIFGRRSRENWSVWGNQVDHHTLNQLEKTNERS